MAGKTGGSGYREGFEHSFDLDDKYFDQGVNGDEVWDKSMEAIRNPFNNPGWDKSLAKKGLDLLGNYLNDKFKDKFQTRPSATPLSGFEKDADGRFDLNNPKYDLPNYTPGINPNASKWGLDSPSEHIPLDMRPGVLPGTPQVTTPAPTGLSPSSQAQPVAPAIGPASSAPSATTPPTPSLPPASTPPLSSMPSPVANPSPLNPNNANPTRAPSTAAGRGGSEFGRSDLGANPGPSSTPSHSSAPSHSSTPSVGTNPSHDPASPRSQSQTPTSAPTPSSRPSSAGPSMTDFGGPGNFTTHQQTLDHLNNSENELSKPSQPFGPVNPHAVPSPNPVTSPEYYSAAPVAYATPPNVSFQSMVNQAQHPSTIGGMLGQIGAAIGGIVGGIVSGIGGLLGAIGQALGSVFGGGGGSGSKGGGSSHSSSGGSKGSSSMGGYGDGSGSRAGWAGKPILLDISGKGLSIDTLGSSQQFIDLSGDGYQHRTAWAGDGTGVLVLDADGDGKVSRSSEFMFTEWDPSAQSDLEAIKNVFDTNHNGLLDAGDLRWADFKVMVNGQLVSLDSLGITSIGLTPKGSGQNFEDGSSITGTAEYTKSDGTTGAVGDAVLAVDPNGYVIKTVATTNADGSKTLDLTGYNKDGTVAFRNRTVTSADGQSKTTQFDDDGNGTWDRSQTDVTTLVAGERKRVVSNFSADGSLKDRVTTLTSTDGKTVTTSIDQDGDGNTDQTQAYVVNTDGSTTTTISQFAVDGTLQKKVSITSSSDGLSKTTSTDSNGDGIYDLIVSETTVVGSAGGPTGDGSRTKTVERRGNDGTLITRETTLTAADGRTKTVSRDLDGNGVFETRDESTISVDANGVVTTTVATYSGTNSLIGKTVATQSANGLIKTTQTDVDGDGTFDVSTSDTTVVASDGARTQTEQSKSTDGALLGQTVTTTSADRKSITIVSDSNGDGKTDTAKTILVDANGVTTTTQTAFNADGSVKGSTWDQSSADGRSITTKADLDADGVYDVVATDVTTTDGSNSQIRTISISSANGTLIGGKVLTTSADSLTQTLREDLDGNGTADLVTTKAIVLAGDGSRTETTSSYSSSGILLGKTTIAVSADRKTSATSIDVDGDGHIDRTVTETEAANGSVTTTVVDASADGVQHAKSEMTKSSNGLILTEKLDVNGDGVYDVVTRSETTIGSDASRTTTVEKTAANGALIAKAVSTTSGNGLNTTTQTDVDGDGTFDVKSTDTTVLNSDGSKTRTVSDFAGTSLVRNSTITTGANGLSSTMQVDLDGNGTVDQTTAVTVALGANGSSTETTTVRAGDNGLLSKSTTTVNADKTLSIVATDANGDGQNDYVKTTSVAADGTTSVTEETFNANGSLDAKTLSTVSANGLTKTKKSDVNGDGVYDLFETDATTLNADGSKTRTIATTSSNGSLISKAISTISGNGLTTTTLTDSTGDGIIDWKVVDQTTLGADGGKTQIVTTRSGNDVLLSQKTIAESGNGRTVTTTTDADGDGAIDTTETITLLDNGSVEKLTRLKSANGLAVSLKKSTISADGLTKTVQTDIDGNGTYDSSVSETTALNTDGYRKTTTQWRTGNGTLVASTETDISRNGLATTTRTDFNGDGIVDESSSDITTLNANGSKTRTVSHFDGANGLRDKTITTTSANGYSVTTASDLDGNGTIDRTSTAIRTVAQDGSVADTSSVVNGSNNLISKTSTLTSADRKSVTSQYDLDGDGNDDVVKSIVTQPNGSVIETVSTYVGTGSTRALASRSVKTISADGLVTTVETDTNGDGTIDLSSRAAKVLNADGSKTETFTNFGAGGSIKDKTIVDTSANGLVVSTQWMANGTSVTRSLDDVTTLGADGSTVRSLTYKGLGGALESKTVTTTSADKKTVTTTIDTDGNGVVDQKSTGVVNADGSITTTFLQLGSDGIQIASRKVVTESANGLTTTTDYDTNGDGTVDNRILETTDLNPDGSKTTTIMRYSGTSQAIERTVIVISADGKTRTESYDLNADGTIDSKQTYSTSFGQRAGYGYATTEAMETIVGSTVKSRYQTTTSGNGKAILKEWDVDGNGSVDQTSTETTSITDQGTVHTFSAYVGGTKISGTTTTTSNDGRTNTTVEERSGAGFSNRTITTSIATLADGSTIETKTLNNTTNNVIEKQVTRTSADGREVTIERDIDGNGTVDQLEQRTKYVDGSSKTVVTGYNSFDRTTFTTSADGLSSTVEWDMDFDGAIDRRRIISNSYNADGSQSSVATDYKIVAGAADTRVRITSTSVSADGRSKSTSIDTNGDGIFDKVALTTIDASGGSVTTTNNNAEAQKADNLVLGEIYWKQAIAAKVVTTISSDGLTATEQSDYDGNGTLETTAVTRTLIDGSKITEFTEVNAGGSVVAKGTLTVSNDGRTRIFTKDADNNGTVDHTEKTELFIEGQIVRTIYDYNPDGTLKQKTGESILGNGSLSHRYVWDGANHKTEEYVRQSNGTALQYTYVGADEAIRSLHTLGKDGKLTGGTFYDPKNTDLWYRIDQSYNADGKKTLEKQFMDDGTSVFITFDPATGKQTLASTYDTSSRLTGQATYSSGILASNVLYDPANAKPWTRVEQTYTSDGTKVSLEKQFMDDGTRADITFDTANTQTWSSNTERYDAAGRNIYGDLLYDNGTRYVEYRDPANAANWRLISQYYNAANVKTEETTFFDDGTKAYTAYDATGSQSWKNYTIWYDTASRIVQVQYNYDDGTRYLDYRDAANASSWSLIVQHFNAAGQQTDNIQTNDDGTSVQTYYDPTNVQNWSVVYYYVDAAGRTTNEDIRYDDGTRYFDYRDVANTQSWNTITESYNASGQITYQRRNNDDGSYSASQWDTTGAYNWASYTAYYNASSQNTAEVFNYDNGTSTTIYYSNQSDRNIGLFYEYRDSAGRLIRTYDRTSYSTTTEVKYDVDNQYNWKSYSVTSTQARHDTPATYYYRIVYDNGSVYTGYQLPSSPGGGHGPVALDLDGDGTIDLKQLPSSLSPSVPRFDWNCDGTREQTSWIGSGDGLLVIDLASDGTAGADGVIDQAKELAFNLWLGDGNGNIPHGISDLEALRLAFDSNHDNVFDNNDERWGEFRIWRDTNQNGTVEAGELKTLTETGITRLGLTSSPEGAIKYDDGSEIVGTNWFETVGGTRNLVGDVKLVSSPDEPGNSATLAPAYDAGSNSSPVNVRVDNLIAAMASFGANAAAGATELPPNSEAIGTWKQDQIAASSRVWSAA